MIRVSVEAQREEGRARASVRAESIRHALDVAGERFPGCEVRVVFPIDPEAFFVGTPAEEAAFELTEVAA